MKRASLLLAFSVLAHLSVIDLVYYFLKPGISVNFFALICYNIIWIVAAMKIGSQLYNEEKG